MCIRDRYYLNLECTFGSNAALIPSPIRVIKNNVIAIIKRGKTTKCQISKFHQAWFNNSPKLGVVGRKPKTK